MTAVACANDDDERISTGVGFGKVVSAKAREENGATIVPSMSQYAKFAGSLVFEWRSDCVAEQNLAAVGPVQSCSRRLDEAGR